MRKLVTSAATAILAIVLVFVGCAPLNAQGPTTVIKVLDPTGAGIANVVLIINPGDTKHSQSLSTQAVLTNQQGEAVVRGLHCGVCVVTAVDPRGLFESRTTEFSGARPFFGFPLRVRPLIDVISIPNAVPVELRISDAAGAPLGQLRVVIRPELMTLDNRWVSIQTTDREGHVRVQLRPGKYAAGALEGDMILEAPFEVAAAKRLCSCREMPCVVAGAGTPHRAGTIQLKLRAIRFQCGEDIPCSRERSKGAAEAPRTPGRPHKAE